MTRRLIVNADDYGHTSGVSAGIRSAHLHGIVTSTTVMINRPYAMEALRLSKMECPRLGVGLHLVLTAGKPVLPAEQVPSLVNAERKFYSLKEFLIHLPEIQVSEVQAEWQAQLARFVLTTGGPPDHLDSHHQVSYFTPALYEEMLKLAQMIECPIRKPFDAASDHIQDYDRPVWDEAAASRIHALDEEYAPRSPRFIGHFYDQGATREHLLEILRAIAAEGGGQTYELMCHPAFVDSELVTTTSYNEQRGRERDLLTDPEVTDFIRQSGIELISFGQL